MLAHFVIRLICGMGLMLVVMPRKGVPGAFFRILLLLILGLGALGAVSTTGSVAGPIVLCVLAFGGSILWMLERRFAGTMVLYAIAAVSLVELGFSAWRQLPAERAVVPAWFFAGDFASAMVLGSTMVGMLLGHRYLTVPGMSLEPLQRLNAYVGASGLARLAVSAAMLVMTRQLLTMNTSYLIWIGLRWLAGIIGPIVVCIMVRQILKYRNTQSATGVLFVGVILAFIGELTAQLLTRELQLPV